jgi:tRNA nucleotidyltransferase/poly(A) polymerase
MADYLYMMDSRLAPDQQRGVALVTDAARAHEMNVYLVGGSVRDIISGASIRDLDFAVQGSALRMVKELEKAGAVVQWQHEELKSLGVLLPGNVRAEIVTTRTEKYDKPGRPPEIHPATITEDLRRRDFTVNAMALSLNPGSRGLLLDPFNGVADVEAKLIRVLHNYAFLEEPSRLIRATRFTARYHWTLEERTQARYNSALENKYIDYIGDEARGREIEHLAYEDDPLTIMRAFEKEGWLRVLHPRWSVAKVDTSGLSDLLKTRAQLGEFGYSTDPAPAILYFLTDGMAESDRKEVQKLIQNKWLVEKWRALEDEAKELAQKLTSREAATPSLTWKLLDKYRPETILFLDTTARQQAVVQKLRNFLGKWRQVKAKIPLPEMIEMRITPELKEYPIVAEHLFYMLIDHRSKSEIKKFLKQFEPPPPPPPPPPPVKRGRKPEPPPAPAPAAPDVKGKGKKGKKGKEPEIVSTTAPAAAAPAGKPGKGGKQPPAPAAAKHPAPAPPDKKSAARPTPAPKAQKSAPKPAKKTQKKPAKKKR